MTDSKIVWSSQDGDLRNKKEVINEEDVNEAQLILHLRRITSSKGRTVIEITNLPKSKKWCKNFARTVKKTLATGGAFKSNFIEVHGEKIEEIIKILQDKNIKWKKTGG